MNKALQGNIACEAIEDFCFCSGESHETTAHDLRDRDVRLRAVCHSDDGFE